MSCSQNDGCLGCLGSHTYGANDLGCGCHNAGATSGATGSCSNVYSDPNNCGYCGHVCSSGVCSSGQCTGSSCAEGTAECDGDPATVCETNILSDSMHCGSCARVCAGSCVAGACAGTVVVSSAGHLDAFKAEDDGISWSVNDTTYFMAGPGAQTYLVGQGGDDLAIDDASVYVGNSVNGTIASAPHTGGVATVLTTSAPMVSHIVATDPANLYYESANAIYSLPKAGGAPPTSVLAVNGSLQGLAVLGGDLYLDEATVSGGTILRVNLATKALTLITDYSGDASTMASNGTHVFFTTGSRVAEYDPTTQSYNQLATTLSALPDFLTATDTDGLYAVIPNVNQIDSISPTEQPWGGDATTIVGLGFISKPTRALVFADQNGSIYTLDVPAAPGG